MSRRRSKLDTGSDLGVRCTGASPGFASAVQPIFQAHCGGPNELCHGGGNGSTVKTFPYASLVGVATSRDTCSEAGELVVPGSLSRSYLMHKLAGIDMCPLTAKMPLAGTPLSSSEVQTIADWICAGALDD